MALLLVSSVHPLFRHGCLTWKGETEGYVRELEQEKYGEEDRTLGDIVDTIWQKMEAYWIAGWCEGGALVKRKEMNDEELATEKGPGEDECACWVVY